MDVSRRTVLTGSVAGAGAGAGAAKLGRSRPPNVLLVYLDDLGYGDLGCYGSPLIRTPNLDRLAGQGTRFTHGYSGAPVCTPSRAALLTGRVPARNGLTEVLEVGDDHGLPPGERTIAEYLRDAGYATSAIGKWHLGDPREHHPRTHGFDHFYGLNAVYTASTYPFDLWRDDQAVDAVRSDADLATLSRRFTDEAVAAIDAAGGKPFFVYLAEVMPHLPLAAEPADTGRSQAGLYGDVIEALDRQLGRLFDALARRKLDHDTLVIVASDNGPWFQGSVGGLRGRKFDVFEGGMRVPFIARWPGVVPAGHTSSDVVTVLDLLPTLCRLAGVRPDPAVTLDGADLTREPRGARPPVYYYLGDRLAAIRVGAWKLHVRRRGTDQRYLPELYDVRRDPGESYDLAARRPDVVARLQRLVTEFEQDVADEEVRGKVRITKLEPDRPLHAGARQSARLTLELVPGPGVPGQVPATATVDVPPGWAADEVAAVLRPGVPVVLEIGLTVPAGTPSPGRVPAISARVTVTGTEVAGAASALALVAPDPAAAVFALDAGTPAGPVYGGYRALTPESGWDPATGYGWVGTPPQARDRGAPDPLSADMVTSTAAAVLRLELPPGPHQVWLLRGDHAFATTGLVVEADGAVVVPAGPEVGAGEYWWERFTLAGGRAVDVRISNTAGAYWKLVALVLPKSM